MLRTLILLTVTLSLLSEARAEDIACDTPGGAQKLVTKTFNESPAARKLGLKAKRVSLLGTEITPFSKACYVSVLTSRGSRLTYIFRVDPDGKASLDPP